MANDNLTLAYNVPVKVRVNGKNAADNAIRPITNVTQTHSFSAQVTIVVTADPQEFIITNTSASATGSGSINWAALNELGQSVITAQNFTLVPADPATHLEAIIIP